jgi:hypothetical protein
MSAEYRPVFCIPFQAIDERLEKYGIKVEFRGATTYLIGPFGTLFAEQEGSSTHFERSLGVDTQAVLDAIETEYGVEIVDENDHRFWGFSSEEQMMEACRHPPRRPVFYQTRQVVAKAVARFALAIAARIGGNPYER